MYKENKNMILGIKDKKPEPRLLSTAKPSNVSTELVEKARKYKSADSYVRGMEDEGRILYHGTNKHLNNISIDKSRN